MVWNPAGETQPSPAAPRVAPRDLHDWEEREMRISKDITGIQSLLTALGGKSNPESLGVLHLRISLPGLWATLMSQGLNLYLPPLCKWLLVHTSECVGKSKLLGNMLEKQARVCGLGRNHRLEPKLFWKNKRKVSNSQPGELQEPKM